MLDTATRLLRLLAVLQTHQHWPGPALAEKLDVSTRTIRADVDRLRELGYDVDATAGTGGGYRLRSGTILPPLMFEDHEAVAVAVALRTAATSGLAGIDEATTTASAKLEHLLPSRLREQLRTLTTVTDTVPERRDPVDPDTLAAVAGACRAQEQLRFDYDDRHRQPSRRRVEPHRLLHVSGRWYLAAYDLDRGDWRSFRVDRISPRVPSGPRFSPRPPPGPDWETFVTRGRMAALWNYRARVVVHADAATVTARIPTGSWTVRPLDEHTSTLHAGAHNPTLLAVYLGALDLDFTIDPHEAPELHHASRALADRYRAAAST